MYRIAQADIRERLMPETISHNRGAFCVWIVAFALLLGIVAFWSQQEWLLDLFSTGRLSRNCLFVHPYAAHLEGPV